MRWFREREQEREKARIRTTEQQFLYFRMANVSGRNEERTGQNLTITQFGESLLLKDLIRKICSIEA